MNATTRDTLADLATHFPAASRIFAEAGLDYCCGGDRPLAEACADGGLSPEVLLERIKADPTRSESWDRRPLFEVIDYILETYHEPLRVEMPRLVEMAAKVERVHADKPACPRDLAAHLALMERSLFDHMDKEEQVLFPLIRRGAGPSASMPVRVMTQEHDDHARNLRRMRELASDFVPPAEACTTWRALFLRLHRLEQDIMEHVHLENHVLFPRALREPAAAGGGADR